MRKRDEIKVAKAAFDLLVASEDGRVDNNDLKDAVAEIVGDEAHRDWRKVNKPIKDQFLPRGIVMLPVGKEWVLNPNEEEVMVWLQQDTGWMLAVLDRINAVLAAGRYKGSPDLQQHVPNYRRMSDVCLEIYEKIQADTGISVNIAE